METITDKTRSEQPQEESRIGCHIFSSVEMKWHENNRFICAIYLSLTEEAHPRLMRYLFVIRLIDEHT